MRIQYVVYECIAVLSAFLYFFYLKSTEHDICTVENSETRDDHLGGSPPSLRSRYSPILEIMCEKKKIDFCSFSMPRNTCNILQCFLLLFF